MKLLIKSVGYLMLLWCVMFLLYKVTLFWGRLERYLRSETGQGRNKYARSRLRECRAVRSTSLRHGTRRPAGIVHFKEKNLSFGKLCTKAESTVRSFQRAV